MVLHRPPPQEWPSKAGFIGAHVHRSHIDIAVGHRHQPEVLFRFSFRRPQTSRWSRSEWTWKTDHRCSRRPLYQEREHSHYGPLREHGRVRRSRCRRPSHHRQNPDALVDDVILESDCRSILLLTSPDAFPSELLRAVLRASAAALACSSVFDQFDIMTSTAEASSGKPS